MVFRGAHPFVATLSILFGIGAWVSINGIWVELPLLITLPEYWALPSYLSVIIQIANIGPIVYSAMKCCRPNMNPVPFIYSVLIVGCLASFLLIFFWDATTYIGLEEHSTALFVLVFFLALVDCTSSVLYLPYMALWKSIYLPLYLVGEGLSGLLPALVALIQGAAEEASSGGGNSTTTSTDNGFSGPNFSVGIFFLILFVMMFCSALAFILLDYLPFIQHERDDHTNRLRDVPQSHDNPSMKGSPSFNEDSLNQSKQNLSDVSSNLSSNMSDSSSQVLTTTPFQWPKNVLIALLFGQMSASLLTNGFMPSIQSYSCAPYGNQAYHLAATLSAFANPLAAFTTAITSRAKLWTVAVLGVVGVGLAAFIIVTASMSPSPPLVGTTGGSVLIISIWIVFTFVLSYVRVEINNLLRTTDGRRGERVLFWSGASTQLGSAVGAVIAFLLVNVAKVFHDSY